MKITSDTLRELLMKPGHIAEVDFELAVKESEKKNTSLERFLVEKGLISDVNLGKTIANAFDVLFIDLQKTKISDDLLHFIPEVVARTQHVIVFEQDNDRLKVATSNLDNYEFINLLKKKTGRAIDVYYATPLGIKEALKYYRSDVRDQIKNFIKELQIHPENEEHIVTLVNLFLEYAHDSRASDIHLEPLENNVLVRFRIDGVLHEIVEYPRTLHEKIVSRIKIMARLRTDEHAAAQDGRFSFSPEHFDHSVEDTATEVSWTSIANKFDVRVSVLPITDGENIVMRLLTDNSRRLLLEDLGLSEDDLQTITRAAIKPHGMLLSVGPTGSGKTTTLYGILQILNTSEVNIMTIEDPVEYDMEHIQQTQVNQSKKLTFVTGLRSIIRQDPDIIMVGEVRDKETAAIAVNAAMTGHLLLSTLHSNDAATTFPRLIDMGIEPFLVSSSINVVMAQRLVRRICQKCRISYTLNEEDLKMLESEGEFLKMAEQFFEKKEFLKSTFYKGAGCKTCGDTGYSGRIGIFEVLEIVEDLRILISQKVSADVIDKKAKELGMTPMFFDGLTKVFKGITTLEEIMRVIKT
ncbi:hypothetical protein COB64_03255 [Candidatus Wolfebacteria bacterium]|nr:MAG: hypothetical protein COB64_03255 [Candidatus Wolfebacteria bacterium]